MMTYKGHVENGTIVLDEPVNLEEGARVRIEVVREAAPEPLDPEILRFTGVLPPEIDARAEHAEGVAKKHA